MNVYLRYQWHHKDTEEPVLYYMELDEQRYVLGWLEIFLDGHHHMAAIDMPTTFVPEGPIPLTKHINDGIDFSTSEISAEEFEVKWAEALTTSHPSQ